MLNLHALNIELCEICKILCYIMSNEKLKMMFAIIPAHLKEKKNSSAFVQLNLVLEGTLLESLKNGFSGGMSIQSSINLTGR